MLDVRPDSYSFTSSTILDEKEFNQELPLVFEIINSFELYHFRIKMQHFKETITNHIFTPLNENEQVLLLQH